MNDLDLMDVFIGKRITDVFDVSVRVGQEDLILTDTAVLALNDGLIQISTDTNIQRIGRIAGIDQILINGDYDDRTSVSLNRKSFDFLPLTVRSLHIANESISTLSTQYLIGIILMDETVPSSLGVRVHLDELLVEPGEALWQYIWRILPNSCAVQVRRLPAEGAIRDSSTRIEARGED